MYPNDLEIVPEHRTFNIIDCRETIPSYELNDEGEIISEKRELVNPCEFAPTCPQIKKRECLGSVDPNSPDFPVFVRVMERMSQKNTEGVLPTGDTLGVIEKASYAANVESKLTKENGK